MEKHIYATVRDRKITIPGRYGPIVGYNTDYKIHFDFDYAWTQVPDKMVRFIYGGVYYDRPIQINGAGEIMPVEVPRLCGVDKVVEIGVYSECDPEIYSTVYTTMEVEQSILCRAGRENAGDVAQHTSEAKQAANRAEEAADRAAAYGAKSAYGYAQDGGYTGTEEEFAEDINPDNINANAQNFIATELAKRGQLKPEFANDISECTDTSKLYVLPDGYIWAYMMTRADYTNQMPASTDIDGNPYNGVGYANGIRINSSGVESAADGMAVTGYMPYMAGETMRIKNFDLDSPSLSYAVFYDADKTFVTVIAIKANFTAGDDGVYSYSTSNKNTRYVRVTAGTMTGNEILTVDEEIKGSGENGYNWANTGLAFVPGDYEERIIDLEEETANHEERLKLLEANEDSSGIPSYWLAELEAKAETIQRAMESAGRTKSAFLWYTDAHWEYTNAKVSPLLLRYLCQNTSMNKVNFGGDIVSDPSELTHDTISYVYEWRKLIADLPNHHSVIGNHDNLHKGRNDAEVANLVYSFLIAPEESVDMVMGDDFYYYIDNPCEKTRYLYLDSGRFSLNDDETKFIIDSLASTPDGWHIVVISHIWFQYTSSSAPTVGSINGHMQVVLNLLDAYNARESGSVTMSYVPHSYDFSVCGGKVEFCIGGHIHVDYEVYSANGIPVIITASDTNQERSSDETEDSGTLGTITESAVFGIIADYDNSKITVVGVGRGTSREIPLT